MMSAEKGDRAEMMRLQPMDGASSSSPLPAKAEEDYDPHQHRPKEGATNNIESLIHFLKCCLGTGILAMPQGFAKAGLITGIIGTVLVGLLTTHCLHMLIRSQYAACKKERVPLLAYPLAVYSNLAHGPPWLRNLKRPTSISVDVFLVTYQLGICCVYIVFISDNIKKVVDPYYVLPLEVHMLIILIPLIMFNLIPSLKILAPFSLVANVLTIVALCIVLYFLLTGERSKEPLDLWGSLSTFPLFFGTIMFALTAVGVVVAIENNMKTPKDFGTPCGVLNTGMIFIVLLYIAVGVIGYRFCVSKCSDSISLDLPKGDPLAAAAMVMYAVAIFISYGLHCFVPVEVLMKGYILPRVENHSAKRKKLYEYILRIGLCLFTFLLAVAVPRLGLFISLFGALCLSALGICFPAIMEACVYYANYPPSTSRTMVFVKDVIYFILGIIGLFAGTYTAIVAIVKSFM